MSTAERAEQISSDKDLLYATNAADSVGLPARIVPVLLELFEAAAQAGQGDHAAVQEILLDS